MNEIVRH